MATAEQIEAADKAEVTDWESVAAYVATFPNGDEDGACDVEVQIGEACEGAWFVRTRDEAGGSDEADDTRYDSEEEAREAAEAFAAANDEARPGEDAEDYLDRQIEERAGEPSTNGEWAVWWETANATECHVVSRYETEEQATAAAEIADAKLHRANPGHLLCGYQVRRLVDGEWVRADEQP